jgi:hypothetical protein
MVVVVTVHRESIICSKALFPKRGSNGVCGCRGPHYFGGDQLGRGPGGAGGGRV